MNYDMAMNLFINSVLIYFIDMRVYTPAELTDMRVYTPAELQAVSEKPKAREEPNCR